MLRTCMCVPVDGGCLNMHRRVLLVCRWLVATLLLAPQRLLPPLLEQVSLLVWRRDGSCNLWPVLSLQVSAPCFHHSRHMAVVHRCQPSNQNTRIETRFLKRT